MKAVRSWFARQRNRAYLYRVIVGSGGVAVAYGLITTTEAVLWAGLVATVFVLPAANTSTDADA